MSSYQSISAEKLSRLIGAPKAPVVIDVRTAEDFEADPRMIPGSGMLLYDAFYRWCRDATGETHNWPSARSRA